MNTLFNYALFISILLFTFSCQKTTNRGIEIEYRIDTIFATQKDTTLAADTANWNAYSNISGGFVSSGPTTYTNTPEGIKIFGQERYSGLRLQTKSEFSIKERVIYYKWKVNGKGEYSAIIPAIKYDPVTSDDYNPIQGVFFGLFTVERTYLSSVLVENEEWYYTRVAAISGTNDYQIATAKNGYSNAGGTIISRSTVPIYTKSGYISLILLNSFSTNAYVILGECKILSK